MVYETVLPFGLARWMTLRKKVISETKIFFIFTSALSEEEMKERWVNSHEKERPTPVSFLNFFFYSVGLLLPFLLMAIQKILNHWPLENKKGKTSDSREKLKETGESRLTLRTANPMFSRNGH